MSWRVYRDINGRRVRGTRFEYHDLDVVHVAYAAAVEATQETGDYPGVFRVTSGGRLNGKGSWRSEHSVHIERVGTDIDAPGPTALDLSLSPDLQRGPAADRGYDMERYARTREIHYLEEEE